MASRIGQVRKYRGALSRRNFSVKLKSSPVLQDNIIVGVTSYGRACPDITSLGRAGTCEEKS